MIKNERISKELTIISIISITHLVNQLTKD